MGSKQEAEWFNMIYRGRQKGTWWGEYCSFKIPILQFLSSDVLKCSSGDMKYAVGYM